MADVYCAWRKLLIPLQGYKPSGARVCHQRWLHDPTNQSFRVAPERCPYCFRFVRIVEDDNA